MLLDTVKAQAKALDRLANQSEHAMKDELRQAIYVLHFLESCNKILNVSFSRKNVNV